MRPTFLPFVAVSLVLGCSDRPSNSERAVGDGNLLSSTEPITYGTNISGDLAVVALARAGKTECTGTVVAPRVVLTAAHCLRVALDRVLFGSNPADPVASRRIVAVRSHPAYQFATRVYDFALILMDDAAPVTPVEVATAATLLEVGTAARVVGYGQTERGKLDVDHKREGFAVVDRVGIIDFDLRPNPSQPCYGDSGGPVFLDSKLPGGTSQLIGVVSEGDTTCVEHSRMGRVTAVLADFVLPFVAATTRASATLGQRCYYAENCVSGECAAPIDTPLIRSCSQLCDAATPCPTGSTCIREDEGISRCRMSPSLGSFGTSCQVHDDCNDARCVHSEKTSLAGVCSIKCLPQFTKSCPTGFTCQLDPEQVVSWSCFPQKPTVEPPPQPPADSSCTVTAVKPSDPTPLWLMIGLAGLLRRRRP